MGMKLVNVQQYLADSNQTNNRRQMIERANERGYTTFFEGVPCVPEIIDFAQEVKKLMPKVKLLPINYKTITVPVNDENGVYQTTASVWVFNEFALYLDEYPLDIGRINFKDNAARRNEKESYGVYSRKIRNAKYAAGRDQHHMVTAKDVKKAVKNVSKYVMPFTTHELAQAFYNPMVSNVSSSMEKVRAEVRDCGRTIGNNPTELLIEIRDLLKQNVHFKTETFKQLAPKVTELMERYEHENSRNVGGTFVRFFETDGQTFFSTQEAIEIRKNYSQMQGSAENKHEGKPVAEIPEDVMGAVAVLSILSDGQYVQNVGMKIDSKHFWIERG